MQQSTILTKNTEKDMNGKPVTFVHYKNDSIL